MIPRVAGSGQSFQGAGLYYLNDKQDADGKSLSAKANDAFTKAGDYALHDKGQRTTAYRVGFTSILNMEAGTPDQAIDQMTASYDRYRQKEANKRGRKLEKPVYVYSLAWAPDQTPSQADMMAAAHSSLKAMRLEGLQTLIVQHTDEPHPHIHIIVNRIEPDGSRARNIPFDHLRFSRWAEQYERDHGGIRCDQRVRNNTLRAQGVMVRDTTSLTRAEYTARERAERQQAGKEQAEHERLRKDAQRQQKADLWANQEAEREALSKRTQARIDADGSKVKKQFQPRWRALYQRQKAEARIVSEASGSGIFDRAVFVFTHRELLAKTGPLRLRDIAKLSLSSKALKKRIERAHRHERAELGGFERAVMKNGLKAAWKDHDQAFVSITARQKRDRDGLVRNHQAEWQKAVGDRRPAPAAAPSLAAPELKPGVSINPQDIRQFTSEDGSAQKEFTAKASPAEEGKRMADAEARKEQLRKELKRQRERERRDRDRGWER